MVRFILFGAGVNIRKPLKTAMELSGVTEWIAESGQC